MLLPYFLRLSSGNHTFTVNVRFLKKILQYGSKVIEKNLTFTVKVWLPELNRKKYGSNI